MKNLFLSKIMILRNQFAKHQPFATSGFATRKEWMSDLMKQAWYVVRTHDNELHIVEATNKAGQKISRVVFTNWNRYNEVKGSGKAKPAGLILLVDAAKHYSGKPSTISFYESNIISLAA